MLIDFITGEEIQKPQPITLRTLLEVLQGAPAELLDNPVRIMVGQVYNEVTNLRVFEECLTLC